MICASTSILEGKLVLWVIGFGAITVCFFFYDNGDDVFRVVITRLPVNIRTLGALLVIVDGCP